MNDLPEERLWPEVGALLEVLYGPRVAERARNGAVLRRLATQGALRPVRGGFVLASQARPLVCARLAELWPEWEESAERVAALGWSPADRNAHVRALRRSNRALARVRTDSPAVAASLRNLHAKVRRPPPLPHVGAAPGRAPPREEAAPGDTAVRFRCSVPVALWSAAAEVDLTPQMDAAGEVALSEDALVRERLRFAVRLAAVFTVENQGAFRHLALPPRSLLIHEPGWNLPGTVALLKQLPHSVPVIHCGDLDPKGLSIARSLADKAQQKVRWFVPAFALELVGTHAMPLKRGRAWQLSVPPSPVLSHLVDRGLWMEQEVIAAHPDCPVAMTDSASFIPLA